MDHLGNALARIPENVAGYLYDYKPSPERAAEIQTEVGALGTFGRELWDAAN